MTPTIEHVQKDEYGDLLCVCGNVPSSDGFYPFHEGHEVEPIKGGPWNGTSYVCARCLRVINYDTLQVVEHPQTVIDLYGDTWTREG